MKAAIDLICRRLTSKDRSHTLSWVMLRANQLKHVGIDVDVLHEPIAIEAEYTAWEKYDTIFIYHEMAMQQFANSKIVNVYDIGYDKSAYFFERLIWPKHDHIKFISLDFPMLDYGNRGRYKAPRPATSQAWRDVNWEKVQERCDGITEWVLDPGFNYGDKTIRHMVMGDSHAHSAYKPKSMVHRKDARALQSILKKGLLNELTSHGYDLGQIDSLTTYYGSIDIRHHLCRDPNPTAATDTILKQYEEELKRAERPIELVTPLPIEDESRQIPKMGWYKGQPFYGPRAERQEVLKRFIGGLHEMAIRNNWTVFEWPKSWYEMDGVQFMNEYLEVPRSVHLGWKHYRWDLVNDRPNPWTEQKPSPKLDLLTF